MSLPHKDAPQVNRHSHEVSLEYSELADILDQMLPSPTPLQPSPAHSASLPFLFSGNFREVQLPPKELELRHQTRFGVRELAPFEIRRLFLRQDIEYQRDFRYISSRGGAAIYALGQGGVEIVFKEELCCYPKIGLTGRLHTPWGRSDFRFMLPVLGALAERGIEGEEPLCWLQTTQGNSFYGVRRIPGINLSDALDQYPEKAPHFAYLTGQALGSYHRRGVIHGHSHDDNILLQENHARMIDAKGVRFFEDYPYTFSRSTGRTVTWDEERRAELQCVAARFEALSLSCAHEFMQGYGLLRLL